MWLVSWSNIKQIFTKIIRFWPISRINITLCLSWLIQLKDLQLLVLPLLIISTIRIVKRAGAIWKFCIKNNLKMLYLGRKQCNEIGKRCWGIEKLEALIVNTGPNIRIRFQMRWFGDSVSTKPDRIRLQLHTLFISRYRREAKLYLIWRCPNIHWIADCLTTPS